MPRGGQRQAGIIVTLQAAGIDADALMRVSVFSKHELEQIWQKFQQLRGREEAGMAALGADLFASQPGVADSELTVHVDVLKTMPLLAAFPSVRRVLLMFRRERDTSSGRSRRARAHELNFAEFISALSHMSGRVTMKDKLNFAFHLFDIDNDGVIDEEGAALLYSAARTCVCRELCAASHSIDAHARPPHSPFQSSSSCSAA